MLLSFDFKTGKYYERLSAERKTARRNETELGAAGQNIDGSIRSKDNYLLFPDMPCMKRVYRDEKAPVHWSAARNEERVSSRG